MDNQAYFDGDFWQCVTLTIAGESPATAPTKWRRVLIPKTFRNVLAKLTYANLLELDGQTDKAKLHRDTGEARLDDLVRDAANRELHGNHKQGSVTAAQSGQSVKAQTIIEDAERLMRWELTKLEDSEKEDARSAFSQALQKVWEAWWWESLMTHEEQALRFTYDFVNPQVYAPVTSNIVPGGSHPEVYFPPTKKYYQVLMPTLGEVEEPAMLVNSAYVVNNLFWAETAGCYAAADYLDGTLYAAGDRVRNPKDGKFYQKVAGVTASGAGEAAVNRSFAMLDQDPTLGGGLTEYEGLTPTDTGLQIFIQRDESLLASFGYNWIILSYDPNAHVETFLYHAAAPGVANAEDVTNWETGGSLGGQPFVGALPGPTCTSQGAPPAVATADAAPFWGRLTPWVPALSYSQPVRTVTREDPRGKCNPGEFEFQTLADGILIPDLTCGTVWITARRVTPVITGNDFDTTTTYEATPPNELVYDS